MGYPHLENPDPRDAKPPSRPCLTSVGKQLIRRPLHLSRASGSLTNTRLEPWIVDFNALSAQFLRPPEVGEKDSDYFVAGPCREGHSHRSDSNLERRELIILDGDSTLDPRTGKIVPGAPSPLDVHIALRILGISHLIHSTHSHQREGKGNRYRVLIPALLNDKVELEASVAWLIEQLHLAGCWLADVKENSTWSQPWLPPRVASDEAEYLCYAYENGQPFDVEAAVSWHKSVTDITRTAAQVADRQPLPREPDSPIARFNVEHGVDWILSVLVDRGYTRSSESQINGAVSYRLLSPHSTSGNPGIVVFKGCDGVWRVHSHHSDQDPLSQSGGGRSTSDAWDLFRIFEHCGNQQAAIAAWRGDTHYAKPTIQIVPGQLADNVAEAVEALAGMRPPLVFQRGQGLCRVAHRQETSEVNGCTLPVGMACIVTLQRAGLMWVLSQAAHWVRKRKQDWVNTDPCPKVTASLLEAVGHWGDIPTLLGISETPILRPDGRIISTSGYDPVTGLWVDGRAPVMAIPEQVSREAALTAARTLLAPFDEFPFVDRELDRSVILAYLITLAVRLLLPTAPLFCFSATTPGSGKGLLVEVANLIVLGHDAATMPPATDGGGDEEARKRITSLLIQGVSSVNLDNNTRAIGGDALNTWLTASEWSDRILGSNEIAKLPSRVTCAATGNNVTVRGDTTRRALLAQVDPGVERPELRQFREKDLRGKVLRDRPELLTALFTILRAYQQAGSPGNRDRLLGRFEEWSAAVCAPIRWLGLPDPLDSQERLREQDPEKDRLEILLGAWFDLLGTRWVSVSELMEQSVEDHADKSINDHSRAALWEALIEAAPDGRGSVNRNKLGWYLKHFTGRVACDLKLEAKPRTSERSKRAREYRVVDLQASG
jgi:hypothetical protein